jgi:hypothetical protein
MSSVSHGQKLSLTATRICLFRFLDTCVPPLQAYHDARQIRGSLRVARGGGADRVGRIPFPRLAPHLRSNEQAGFRL